MNLVCFYINNLQYVYVDFHFESHLEANHFTAMISNAFLNVSQQITSPTIFFPVYAVVPDVAPTK